MAGQAIDPVRPGEIGCLDGDGPLGEEVLNLQLQGRGLELGWADEYTWHRSQEAWGK